MLVRCEDGAAAYRPGDVVPVASEGRDVVVMSDLHLGEGAARDHTYASREKFFADDSFARLLTHLRTGGGRHLLVLNGDVVDFLRVGARPLGDRERNEWASHLQRIGVRFDERDLTSLTLLERHYGFGTSEPKSVWKLLDVIRGHEHFFDALADWLAGGNDVVVTKGNHDLEWFWRGVRDTLRVKLADSLARRTGQATEAVLERVVLPRIRFVDHALLVDGTFYIEHGHQYDPFSRVVGPALLPGDRELNLPMGSFFNRYILNKVELSYPFTDNIRPRQNVLPMLVRDHFPSAVKLLAYHLPAFLVTVPKGRVLGIYWRPLVLGLAIALPFCVVAFSASHEISAIVEQLQQPSHAGVLDSLLGSLAKSTALLVASYALARLTAYFQIEEPDSLWTDARALMGKEPAYRQVTLGHTHNPEQRDHEGRWFFNTGTWVPIIETDSAQVREDRTYTYLHVPSDDGRLATGRLLRWNDDAGRSEPALIVRRQT